MLTLEWRRRIDTWRDTMPKLLYRPVGEIAFDGFVTRESLTPSEALRRRFKPMPAGTAWGAKWECGWFRGTVRLPRSVAGERVAMRVAVGGEAAILVDGAWHGANDIGHTEVTLARKARGGETFRILVESYAGHGPRECGGGPNPHGNQTVPEPPRAQVRVDVSTFGIWEEELYQLWLDVETLLQLRDHMPDKESLRVAEIDDALRRMTLAVDLELPRLPMLKTVREGRRVLRRALACRNGSTAPRMSCFGHSHIDVAWLWPLSETERKCSRTFASQLALMEEYPHYRFFQSQAHLYWMVKGKYPQLYERIKKAVRKGQWIVDGGMWVEADTNITGGESLIRQFLHGKRFFKEEFGVESRLMWLPDVFGYSGALPQIMRGCGIRCFSTQKIFWLYHGGDPFPYNLFWWEGIDGTRVLSYFHNDYNSQSDPRAILARWNDRVQKDSTHPGRLQPFGWGDGGGGPTRNHIEFLNREKNLEGMPRCEMESPSEFFRKAGTEGLPSWVGELYYQSHRGTYTSQARTKRGNRLSELALREAECWGAIAAALGRSRFPTAKIRELWQMVLLNQFHDIIPGSSIHRVYEEAEASCAEAIRRARSVAESARSALARPGGSSLTVFNSLSWRRNALVEIPREFGSVETEEGLPLDTQRYRGRRYVRVPEVPACGWRTVRKSSPRKSHRLAACARATPATLENEFLKVALTPDGELASVFDKERSREATAGPCNRFRLYKDVPGYFDAWDIDSMYKSQPVEIGGRAKVTLGADGPLFASIRVEKPINHSMLTQEITLCAGSRRIDFSTRIDWRESHKLLKVNFPVNFRNEDALHEIQFGHVRRPTHATRPYDAARFEVCNQKWTALVEETGGAAVLNDCKYGVSVEGNSINLTLLRSPLAPDMTADRGVHEFTYAFYCWSGSFRDGGVIQSAYELNVPATVARGAAGRRSLFETDCPNVVVETVKPSEDGSGDVVVRLYEASRSATRCSIRTSLPHAEVLETDMLEKPIGWVASRGGVLVLEFRPFEIKTLRFRRRIRSS